MTSLAGLNLAQRLTVDGLAWVARLVSFIMPEWLICPGCQVMTQRPSKGSNKCRGSLSGIPVEKGSLQAYPLTLINAGACVSWMAHCTATDGTCFFLLFSLGLLVRVADERALSVGRAVAGIFNRWATPFAQTSSTCKVQGQDGGQKGSETSSSGTISTCFVLLCCFASAFLLVQTRPVPGSLG